MPYRNDGLVKLPLKLGMSDYIQYFLCDAITYPFPNVTGSLANPC